jgi:hypothetical protein
MNILDDILAELKKQRNSDTRNYSDMGNYEVFVDKRHFAKLTECIYTWVAANGLDSLIDLPEQIIDRAPIYSVYNYPVPFRVVRV